ncbi:MAG: hypothetical protein K6F91_01725 [Ruminococcus sp.]|nr:hypothetical protein [Ruminococcus sp.]
MSSKTVEENYRRLRAELDELLSKDKRLTAIADKISKGTADFSDTARYTQIVSKHMSDVIKHNIGELKQPMAKEMVCKELLRDHYELINGVFSEVQVRVDEKLGIHLNPIKPAYPAERVDSWAHSLEDPTVEPSVTERRAASGSENIGNSMHDACIKENAKVREQAGLDCHLTRDAGGGCCPWCQALEGRYSYADAPDDIFRRHDNCTCTVTYECGRQRQDVWSKKTWEASEDELQARKEAEAASKPVVNSKEQAKEFEKVYFQNHPSLAMKSVITDMFEEWNNGQKNTIKFRNIEKELEKSDIGKEIKDYLKNAPCKINIMYNVDVDKELKGLYDPINDEIYLYASNTKTVSETAATLIHEVTHRRYEIGGNFWSECVCKAQELKHKERKNVLTISEKRDIIKSVKETYSEIYPDMKWRRIT